LNCSILNSAILEAQTSRLGRISSETDRRRIHRSQNLTIEYPSADGRTDRLAALVADLIRRHVDILFNSTASALATKEMTSTIPIVS
jgi:hypothetical protein